MTVDHKKPGILRLDPDPGPIKQPTRPKLRDILGPGLITGASDDDPSGIATYSQAGAAFGYSLGWTMLFSWPLMCAVQEISARLGRVTGRGIAANLKRHYPWPVVAIPVFLLLFANIINLAADLGAMAAALKLVIGGHELLYVAFFGISSTLLEVFIRYSRYVSFLKWLTLSVLAYVAVAFVVHVPWRDVAYGLFVPQIQSHADYLTLIVAVLGTTITPYLFFWQAEEEVEEIKEHPGARALERAPEQAEFEFRRIRYDTYLGMGLSNLVALFIMITTAATLHAHGVTAIQTSAQAAEALRPVAGAFAFWIFALGIIGTGLLAVPVLAGSSAYALAEMFGWHASLARKFSRAKGFYGIIAGSFVAAMLLNFTSVDPIKMLVGSAVINGVAAVPILVMLMLLAGSPGVMGRFSLPRLLQAAGWLTTGAMTIASVALIGSTLAPLFQR